jgi:hypothetical protein
MRNCATSSNSEHGGWWAKQEKRTEIVFLMSSACYSYYLVCLVLLGITWYLILGIGIGIDMLGI